MKQKLNQFKVQIRRQFKEKRFNQLRKQNHLLNRINEIINLMSNLDVCSLNLSKFKDHFHDLNIILLQMSKQRKDNPPIFPEINLQNLQISRLEQQKTKFGNLISVEFKLLRMKLFEVVIQQNKMSIEVKELEFQLVLSSGLLFKQFLVLITDFPLKTVNRIVSPNTDFKEYQNQIDTSFELFQKSVFYLKKRFYSIKKMQLNQFIILLSIIHSITRVMQYFTLNFSQISNLTSKQLQFQKQKIEDWAIIKRLYTLLQSHNIENFMKKIMTQLVQLQQNNSEQKHQNLQILSGEISLIISISQFAFSWFKMLKCLGHQTTPSRLFEKQVILFNKKSLERMKMLSQLLESPKIETERSNEAQNSGINIFPKKTKALLIFTQMQTYTIFRSLEIIPLINLHQLICESLLYIGNSEQSDNLKYIHKTFCNEFYFEVLKGEENQSWTHQLELLFGIEDLVNSFGITLDDLILYQEKEKQNEQFEYQSESKLDTIQTIQKVFNEVIFCINGLSSFFYNERHVFMRSFTSIITYWIDSSINNKKTQIPLDFWIKTAENILKATLNIKDSVSLNFQNVSNQSTYEEPELDFKHKKKLKQENQSVLEVLEQIQLVMEQTIRSLTSTNQIQI